MLDTIKQAVIKQWRGEYPALFTILGLLLALRIAIGLIPVTSDRAIAITVICISLAMLVWQVVGGWRCIERSVRDTGEMMMYWLGWAAIICVLWLTALHTIDLWVGPAPTLTTESLRKKPLPSLSADGKTVYLSGELDFNLHSDLETLLERHSTITTIELSSDGGLIFAGRALAITIEKYGLDTHVERECNSACTLAFMAGKRRTLGVSGKIGFHQYEQDRQNPLQNSTTSDEQDVDRRYFASRGVSEAFLKQVYQSKHNSIWQPERDVLLSGGVISE